MLCQFCKRAAVALCEFPVTEPRIFMPGELKVGDLLQSVLTLEYHIVDAIQETGTGFAVAFRMRHPTKRTGQLRLIKRTELLRRMLPVLVLTTLPCEASVCESHYLDTGRIVCPYHWEVITAAQS